MMCREIMVYLLLAASLAKSIGCRGSTPVVRGQSPDRRINRFRLRRRVRKEVEPVQDATWKMGRKAEPAWQKTKDVTRKGLMPGAIIALLGGVWWLEQETGGTPGVFGNESTTSFGSCSGP